MNCVALKMKELMCFTSGGARGREGIRRKKPSEEGGRRKPSEEVQSLQRESHPRGDAVPCDEVVLPCLSSALSSSPPSRILYERP